MGVLFILLVSCLDEHFYYSPKCECLTVEGQEVKPPILNYP
jgi:hypothetical protein